MVRIRRVWYWKRYMTKNRYRCKRYRLYLPNAVGDVVDTSLEYVAKLFGQVIVIIPKGDGALLSRLENLETRVRGNTAINKLGPTTPVQER